MADSIITKIEQKIETLISAMTTSEYNFNWNSIVEPSEVENANFPSAGIVLIEENNIDAPELSKDCEDIIGPTGAFANAYYNAIKFTITIGGTAGTPFSDIAAKKNALNKALDDIKKLFGINYFLENSGCSSIMYRKAIRTINKDNTSKAGTYETTWIARYYQDRKNPSLTAEV